MQGTKQGKGTGRGPLTAREDRWPQERTAGRKRGPLAAKEDRWPQESTVGSKRGPLAAREDRWTQEDGCHNDKRVRGEGGCCCSEVHGEVDSCKIFSNKSSKFKKLL
jgi:hypothetical protein